MADNQAAAKDYIASPEDRRLIDEFKRTPIGHHSPALQRLLTRLRGAAMPDKFCLVVIQANREWQLARTSGVPGKPLKLLEQRFTSMADAEWYVFRQRWKALTGESLQA